MEPLVSILVVLSISAAFGMGYATNAYGALMFFGLALLVGLCMQRVRSRETIVMLRFGRLRSMEREGYFLFIPLIDRMIDVIDRVQPSHAADSAATQATGRHVECDYTARIR